jgi:hypothetical protein
MPSGEIRNMHRAYGYYGLYIYLRKELRFFGVVRRKSCFGARVSQEKAEGGEIPRPLPRPRNDGSHGFHTISNDCGLYCPGEVK